MLSPPQATCVGMRTCADADADESMASANASMATRDAILAGTVIVIFIVIGVESCMTSCMRQSGAFDHDHRLQRRGAKRPHLLVQLRRLRVAGRRLLRAAGDADQ